MIETGGIDVHLGLDVGSGEHHATAVTPAGKKAFDKRLPDTEPKLRELFGQLQAKHGTALVDQSASIGATALDQAQPPGEFGDPGPSEYSGPRGLSPSRHAPRRAAEQDQGRRRDVADPVAADEAPRHPGCCHQ
ncbi:transposase [Streptomyces sp. SM11]|uniref:IS110 family transposase n=1 Tax=Streptomyces sp. SM11 TaxID=565557 RepID=UPI0035BBEB58